MAELIPIWKQKGYSSIAAYNKATTMTPADKTAKVNVVNDIKTTYDKGIASGKTKEQVIGAMKDKLKTTGQYDTVKNIVAPTKQTMPGNPNQVEPAVTDKGITAPGAIGAMPIIPVINETNDVTIPVTGVPEKVDTTKINSSEDAAAAVTNVIKDNIVGEQKAVDDKVKALNTQTIEDKAVMDTNIKTAEDYAKKFEDLVTKNAEEVKGIRAEQQTLIDEGIKRYTENLEAKKTAEIEKQNADLELQKFQNQQAITKANKDVYTAKIQANVAFNKLGLTFSAGAIKTTQTIATEGATAIAGLVIQASYNEASMKNKIADLEYKYTKDINNGIDLYTQKGLDLKETKIREINGLQNNLLLNQKEKDEAITAAKKEYLTSKRANEDAMFNYIKEARESIETKTKALGEQIKIEEANNINKGKLLIASGGWSKLSDAEKVKKEADMGLPAGTINTEMNSQVNTLITGVLDKVMGTGYLLPNREVILNDIQKEMKNGRDLQTATTLVLERNLKNNPDYIAKQKAIKDRQAAEIQALTLTNISTKSNLESLGYINEAQYNTINKSPGEKGGQCGVFANRATGLSGEPGGDDSIAGRTKTYTDKEPVAGGLAFFKGGNYDKKNGHVSVVQSVNGDGTITLKESNLKGDGKITIRTVPVSEVSGFYNSTPLAKGGISSGGKLSDLQIKDLAKSNGITLTESDVKDLSGVSGDKQRKYIQNRIDEKKSTVDNDITKIASSNNVRLTTDDRVAIKSEIDSLDKNSSDYLDKKDEIIRNYIGNAKGAETDKPYEVFNRNVDETTMGGTVKTTYDDIVSSIQNVKKYGNVKEDLEAQVSNLKSGGMTNATIKNFISKEMATSVKPVKIGVKTYSTSKEIEKAFPKINDITKENFDIMKSKYYNNYYKDYTYDDIVYIKDKIPTIKKQELADDQKAFYIKDGKIIVNGRMYDDEIDFNELFPKK